MLYPFDYISLCVVSVIWGSTNALLKRYASTASTEATPENHSFIQNLFTNLWHLILNWKFTLTFLGNQCGSILYYWLLSGLPLTIVVPIVNALTFLFTALTGCALGEKRPNLQTSIGALLIIAGIALCLMD